MHSAEPIVDLYFDITQASHSPPSGPVYPALHLGGGGAVAEGGGGVALLGGGAGVAEGRAGDTQSSPASLPAGELMPTPQLMQALAVVAPTVGEYLPAAQSVHLAGLTNDTVT